MRNGRRGKEDDRIRPRIALWPTIEFMEEVVEMDEKTEIHRIIVDLDEGLFQFISFLAKADERSIPDLCGALVKLSVKSLMQELRKTLRVEKNTGCTNALRRPPE